MSDGHLWHFTAHVCGACYGRVLARPGEDDGSAEVYRCANCGVEREGEDESAICACGLPGVECLPNDDVTAEWPGEVVAVAVGGG
uniref:Uncharacterized protein n=1 Tax=Ralstonia solanacearum TaxID=305 RepID=A0A0S4UXM0_RALSL|nr:conserved protein of unknown function [Ralstonia solanacearum]